MFYFSKETYKKIIETAKLRAQYLYSTVINKRITDDDIDSVFTDQEDPSIRMIADVTKKLYRSLTREEQEILISTTFKSLKFNENNTEELEHYYEKIANSRNIYDPYELIDEMAEAIGGIANNVITSYILRLEELPPILFKKCFMSLLKDGINVDYIKEVLKDKMHQEEQKEIEKLKEDPEKLVQLLTHALQTGNMKAVELYSRLLDEVNKNNNDSNKGYDGSDNDDII